MQDQFGSLGVYRSLRMGTDFFRYFRNFLILQQMIHSIANNIDTCYNAQLSILDVVDNTSNI